MHVKAYMYIMYIKATNRNHTSEWHRKIIAQHGWMDGWINYRQLKGLPQEDDDVTDVDFSSPIDLDAVFYLQLIDRLLAINSKILNDSGRNNSAWFYPNV